MRQSLALIALAAGFTSAAPSFGGERLAIGGIAPGAKLTEIVAKFDSPLSQERSDGFITLWVIYDRLSFGLDEDGLVANIKTSNPNCCFNGWLCPGMSLAKAKEKVPDLLSSASGDSLVAYSEGNGCWLELVPIGEQVASLAIECQP